jgi:hypothetical protein
MDESAQERGRIRLEIEITADQAREIEALIETLEATRGCTRDEGLRMLLGAGLAALRSHLFESQMPEDELARLRKRLLEVEQSLAVTRFRLFEAQEANRSWALSTGAIRNENQALKGLVDRLRGEIAELRRLHAGFQGKE